MNSEDLLRAIDKAKKLSRQRKRWLKRQAEKMRRKENAHRPIQRYKS